MRALLVLITVLLFAPAATWADTVCKGTPGSAGPGNLSGIVNTYFQGVTGTLAAGATSITLGTQDSRGAATPVAVGDLLLVIQMQDGTINSSNSIAYGDGTHGYGTTSVGSAGLYEFVAVTALTSGTGSTGSVLQTSPALTNTYTQAAATATQGQKRYQVIRVPQYSSATAAGVIAPPWGLGTGATGETGGVVVIDVRDTLTLGSQTVEGLPNRAIFVAGKGFRGGAGTQNGSNGPNTDWVSAAPGAHGGKGEGIAGLPRYTAIKTNGWGFQNTNNGTPATSATLTLVDNTEGLPGGSRARGAPGNAGGGGTDGNASGGGNNENAGGGAGSNYGGGGLGGRPWNAPLVDTDGRGGAPYSGVIQFNRVFMGGGGGSGGTNDGTSDTAFYQNQGISCSGGAGICSSGAAGGGIVILRARTVVGTGIIDVRGANGYNVGNDAAGGGGGGGSVVIWSIAGGSANADASGGDGGNAWGSGGAGTGNRHGPGGGGGGGFIVYSPQTFGINAAVNGGVPGRTTNGASDTYSSTSGDGGLGTFQPPNAPGVPPGALCTPNLTLTKTNATSQLVTGVDTTYTLTATNIGSVDTTAPITVIDTLPASLDIADGAVPSGSAAWTCTAATGTITCTSPGPIAAGASSSFSLTVHVTGGPGTAVVNKAAVGGGGDPGKPTPVPPTSCTANDTPAGCAIDSDTILAPLLSLTKSDGVTSIIAGAATTYSLVVSNNGAAPTSGTITVVDVLPTGLNYTGAATFATGGFNCTYTAASTSFTCTSAGVIAANGSATLSIPVTVAVNAPGAVTNLAQVGGGGDPVKSTPTVATTQTCPAPVAPATMNSDTTTGCAADSDAITHVNLQLAKTDNTTTLAVGGSTTYVFTVTNRGDAATVGTINFRDVLPTVGATAMSWPASLTVVGAPWTCVRVDATNVTCDTSGTPGFSIPAGGSSTFSIIANAGTATQGNQYLNKARITGGGDADLGSTPPTSTDVGNCITTNDPIGCATDLDTAVAVVTNIAKSHTGNFAVGATGTYTLAITNSGNIPTTGTITVVDTLPAGLTLVSASGTGWTCSGTTTITCTSNAVINAGGTGSPITVVVNVLAAAVPSVTNTATISGGGDSTCSLATPPAHCSSSNPTTVANLADLTISKVATPNGTYLPGGAIAYTITVGNSGPTDAPGVSVTDTVPASITGVTWTCATASGAATCGTASGTGNAISLASVNLPKNSSIAITVNGTVALSATGSIVNTATATPPTGFTCTTAPCAKTATATNTNAGTPQLTIVKTATPGAFAIGQTGTYSLLVSNLNSGTSTSTAGTITVSDPLPAGIVTTATPSGTGWDCSASTTTNVSCTTSAVLVPGANAPVINVPVQVNASAAVTNTATVSGGGDGACPAAARCNSTITTTVNTAKIDVTKTLSGNLVVGVPASYVITATNNGQAATLAGTISDTIPTGLTIGTLPGGCSIASGQTISCAIPAGLATGGSVSFTIPITPQASTGNTNVQNTATANNGGDPTCPAAGHCAGVVTNTVTAPQLALTKSATPTTFVVGDPATYTLALTNNGTAATTAATTISDTIPSGLTIGTLPAGCTASAQTVTCVVASGFAVGANTTFAIPVTPTNALNGMSATNTAGATGGGDPGCATGTAIGSLPARCVGTVTTPVNAPQLTLTKTASGAFAVGVAASYSLAVQNTGTAPTSGTITITDVIPGSLAIGTLPAGCSAVAQQVTCTSSTALAVGATLSFTIPVTPGVDATPSVTNTATAQGGGDPTCPTTTNCTSTITTPVSAPALQVTKTANGAWTVNQTGALYTLSVKNAGGAATSGAVSVVDALPAGITPQWSGTLTTNGWSCTFAGQTVTCTATPNLAVNATSAIVLPVNVTTAAVPSGSGPSANLVNNASVAGGGDPFNGGTPPTPGGACTALDAAVPGHCASATTIVNASADVAIVKSVATPNPVVPGLGLTWQITVTNNGPSEASAVTTSDTVPNAVGALALGGADAAACSIAGQIVSCSFGTLANGATRTFSVSGTLAADFSGDLLNTANVATTANDPVPANNSSTSTTPSAPSADMAASITLPPTAVAGAPVSGTFACTNNGPSAAANATCVPTGLPPGANVNCTPTPPVASLAVGATISCTVDFTAPSDGSVSVTVTAGSTTPDPNSANNTAVAPVTVTPKADLTVTKTATPNASYLPNQPISYTIVVANAGPSDVSALSVTDTVPAAVVVSGWTCSAGIGADCDAASGGTGASGTGNAIALANVSIPGGSSLTITVNGTVASNAIGDIVNTATATPPDNFTCSTPPCTRSSTVTNSNGGAAQITIVKTATPTAFAVGQTGTYSLSVQNTGTTSTSGAIVVTDTLPAGITTTAPPSGTGWDCSASTTTVLSCTTAAVLVPGANAPVLNAPVAIAVSAAAPSINTATVQGGGDPSCPADTTHCASTISTPVNQALIDVTKSLTGSLIVGIESTYVITATNNGQAATLAGTISDTIPAGLSIGTLPAACSASGQTVTCSLPAGLGTGASVSYPIAVTPLPVANGSNVTNTASASGGGDPTCPGAAHCDGTVTNTVTAPQLQLVKSATPGTFVIGQPATYTLTLTNTGTADTTATTTITDVLPSGLVIGTLPSGCANPGGQTVVCTIAAGLHSNAPVMFAIPVTVQNSLNGLSVTNRADATGGGDPGCVGATPIDSLPARCVGTVTTPVNAPQLTIAKSASVAAFIVGVPASYTLQVSNTGSAATTATATVTDVVPNTLTIGTLPAGCGATGQQITCTIAANLAPGHSASFVIPVTPTAAAHGQTLSNTATVLGGGDPTCPNTLNCTSTVTTPVDAPQLRVNKTASAATFEIGVPASYTLTVTNTGTAATTAAATISDNVPGVLTIGTLPADCTASSQLVTCTVAAGLPAGGQASFTIPVTPTANANGSVLSNTATVSGGGDPGCPSATNPNCTSTVTTPVNAAQLRIVKTAPASFTVGVAATYTLTVTNTGSAPTTASATVVDNVPASLTITSVSSGCVQSTQSVTCTIPAGLAANATATFTISITPTNAASGTIVANTASVSGGGDPTCPNAGNANCSSTVTTPVDAPQLQIVKTASAANFTVATPASYTLTLTNIGSVATTAVATIVDSVPAGLTIGAMDAACSAGGQQVTCTVPAGLAAGASVAYTIAITPTASAASTVVNTANAAGGGDPTCPNAANPNCSSSVTTPVGGNTPPPSADLRIVKTGPATVTRGSHVTYTITVTNLGPDSAVNAFVSDPAPAGLTFVSSGAPCAAFPCSLGTLASGQTVTIPNVTFAVPANYAPTSIVNIASASSDTPDPTPTNNSSTVSTTVTANNAPLPVPAPIDARWMLLAMTMLLAGFGIRRVQRGR